MACPNCDSIMESLHSDLNVALEDGRYRHAGERHMILVEALSKVQRELKSRKLALKNIGSDGAGSTNQVSILAWESDQVSHSAAKAILALWQYTTDVPSCWSLILDILWRASKSWAVGSVQDGSVPIQELVIAASTPLQTSPNLSSFPQSNWTAVSRDFQVLHNILNNCKQEASFKIKIFFNVGHSYIRDTVAYFTEDQSQASNMRHQLNSEIALAALLRLLCSIIHSLSLYSECKKVADFIGRSQILASMEIFLPTLSFRCLVQSDRTCVSHYVCYKYQMILFRLREWFTEKPSLAVMCFEILKSHVDDHFGGLFQRQAQWTSPVLQSPFAPFLTEQHPRQSVSSSASYFNRHTIFLIFKVVVSLKNISCHGSTGIDKASKRSGMGSGEQCASQVERWLLDWLTVQINFTVVDVSKINPEKIADGLALSFIRIFGDEDNLMLEMLLLLLDTAKLKVFSLCIDSGGKLLQMTQNLLLSIFKPLRLFAVLLHVVQYDHSTIVEFLISKDTSILCLQYLLRCLHITQKTWPDFLTLSCRCSDRKDWKDRSHLLATDINSEFENVTDEVRQSPCSFISDTIIDVKNAANCLLSLKLAVERLHRKHVFPYNPSALLRNLDSFEQLWNI